MSEISAGVPMNEPTAPAVIPEENKYLDFKTNYSQTLLYRHPLNMNTSLLWRVCFVPGERRLFTFNTDTFYGPLSVGINGVWLYVQYISRWLAPHPLPMRASLYNNMQVQLNLHM